MVRLHEANRLPVSATVLAVAFYPSYDLPLTRFRIHKKDEVRALASHCLVPPAFTMEPQTRRVAIVTGAAQGIGAAIAQRLAQDGLDVALFDLPTHETLLKESASHIRAKYKTEVICVVGDVSKEEDVQRLVDSTVRELGGLDVVSHHG